MKLQRDLAGIVQVDGLEKLALSALDIHNKECRIDVMDRIIERPAGDSYVMGVGVARLG